ncbi:hypothetical protein L195_g010773 [Trifolium pratense]|nr:hypothetical protein L195_g010773 [Trifolium pratense]
MEDYSQLSESEDSINGSSYPMHQGSLKIQRRDLTGSISCNSSSNNSILGLKDKPRIEFVETLEDKSFDEDFTDGKTTSKTMKDIELVCSVNKYLPARGNHLPRPVIPIGPMFQAEVPNWEDKTDIKQYNGDYGLKWLGTQIWPIPIPIISETNTRDIQKGVLELRPLEDLDKILH